MRLSTSPFTLRRRAFLHGALLSTAAMVFGAKMSGCSVSPSPSVRTRPEPSAGRLTSTGRTVLLAYFSRAGENYSYGGRTDLTVGNTEVLAGLISQRITCDVHRIEPADPYPMTTTRPSSATSRNKTPMPVQPSRTHWPRSRSTILCWWVAQSGTSERR
jgi:hypothetical protein